MTEMEQKVAVLESRIDHMDKRLDKLHAGVSKNTGILLKLEAREKFKAEEYEKRERARQRKMKYVLMLGTALAGIGSWIAEHWHRLFK